MIRSRGRVAAFVAAASLVAMVVGCVTPHRGAGTPDWGSELTDTERGALADAFPPDAVEQLLPLSSVFYARITSRRFNSRATFEDPSVRQFFPTVAAYSDYYAALVDALDTANIEYNRPTRVDLLGVEVDETGHLRASLRFVGRNDLPLRFWGARLLRTDEWAWRDGRWFVVPGKI